MIPGISRLSIYFHDGTLTLIWEPFNGQIPVVGQYIDPGPADVYTHFYRVDEVIRYGEDLEHTALICKLMRRDLFPAFWSRGQKQVYRPQPVIKPTPPKGQVVPEHELDGFGFGNSQSKPSGTSASAEDASPPNLKEKDDG